MSERTHSNSGPQVQGTEGRQQAGQMMAPPALFGGNDGPVQAKFAAPPALQLKGEENESELQEAEAPVQLQAEPGSDAPAAPPSDEDASNTDIAQMAYPGVMQKKDEGGATTAITEDYRSITLDIAKDKAKDFAWDYWDQLKSQYSIADNMAQLLERAMLYLIDWGVRVSGVGAYLAAINPYLEILKVVIDIVEAIPQPIRVFLGYAIGYGIKYFSDNYMNGAIKEKHINILLIEGGDVISGIADIVEFLYDLGHNPVRTIYRGIWAAVRAWTGDDELDSFADLLLDDKRKERAASGSQPAASGGREGQESGDSEQDEMDGVEKAKMDNLFNADLGFFWVRLGNPKLERWNEEDSDQERGGLAIDGGMGVKIFGQSMGTDQIDFRLPYSADWEMTFTDLSILSEPISLGNFFRGGPVTMTKLRLKSGVGVDYMHLLLEQFAFGDDVFVADQLSMTYDASHAMLNFAGDTRMNFWGHEFLGSFALDVGTDGQFKGGMVDIMVPEELELLQDRLSLSNLNFIGRWGEEGVDLLELSGDVHMNILDRVDFDATRAAIRYEDGEFKGLVDEITVMVPLGGDTHAELILANGMISREGFEAERITLIFSYGDQQREEDEEGGGTPEAPNLKKEDLPSIIPGFNMDWAKSAGLETLVVSASANGVKLGRDGFSMDGDLEKKLHKFAAELLGVRAEFDGDKNEGTLQGDWNYDVPNLPAISFDFPIIPGINAGVGLSADIGFGAHLDGTLHKLPHEQEGAKQPWEIRGSAGLNAHAGVRAHFDVSAGHPLLVSIHAGLFAEAAADFQTDAAMHGVVEWDDDAHKLGTSKDKDKRPSASFDLSADLTANLGASIKARAFHIFEVTLWEYKFVEWHMGLWRAKGRMEAKEDGGYEFKFEQTGFDGGVPGRKPIVEYTVANTEDVILDRERKGDDIKDPLLFWRLVHDVMDPTQGMTESTRMVMMAKLQRLNDTGDDFDSFMQSTTQSFAGRTDRDSDSFSMLMLPGEWEQYSTTRGWFGKKKRKSVKAIDRALSRYHREKDVEKKKDILIDLIDNLIPEYLHEGHSRDAMVAKLHHDARRELDRLEAIPDFE